MLSIFIIIIAVLIWGAVHSLTASLTAKAIAGKWFGIRHANGFYRLLYNIFSVITFIPLLLVVFLLPDQPLYNFPIWLVPITTFIQAVSVIAVLLAVIKVDAWQFIGLRQLLNWLESSQPTESQPTLIKSGMFAWMRHPIYFFSIVAMWLMPVMTLNSLALYMCFTIYFWVGSIFEERKLVAEFGEDYKQHQRTVPRIVPFTKWGKK